MRGRCVSSSSAVSSRVRRRPDEDDDDALGKGIRDVGGPSGIGRDVEEDAAVGLCTTSDMSVSICAPSAETAVSRIPSVTPSIVTLVGSDDVKVGFSESVFSAVSVLTSSGRGGERVARTEGLADNCGNPCK